MARARTAAGWFLAALLTGSTLAACSSAAGDERVATRAAADGTATVTTGPPSTPATTVPAPTTTAAPTITVAPAPPPAPPRQRSVTEQAWTPFAAVAGITLVHPSSRVERVGFHQSNHEGARDLTTLPTAASPVTLDARDRLTGAQTAADVVVDPAVEIRSPVTGTVKRAGGYVLYCRHRDDFVVIAPDAQPGWEVKILHINGVQVRPGDRVVAGETLIAPAPTQLPFESQVDEVRTADPPWPHVHIEVVDPSIPNRPSPGGGC